MRILHTGDLHLVDEGDRRWEALIRVLSVARRETVNVLVISGDLFDSDADADALRVPLRPLFEGAEFDTLIIPGNHDSVAYESGLFFGERVHVLAEPDWSKNIVDTVEARFIGIPFEELDAQEFRRRLRELRDSIDPNRTNILIYHGELLDASFDRDEFGPESGRYMPSRLAFFEELGVDYVLAGHFHTRFDVWGFDEDSFYVYPGSPVSITRREVGRRKLALIETGKAPRDVSLDTHHFERVEITLNAFAGNDPLEVINKRLRTADPAATVLLSVRGTIDGDEDRLVEAIKAELADRTAERPEFYFRDVGRVVSHPVFALFEERLQALQEIGDDAISERDAGRIREIVIQAISEAQI